MKLPLILAEKLQQLSRGENLQASKLNYPLIAELLSEGILYKPGKIKSLVQVIDKEQLNLFLKNRFSINDLDLYIDALKNGDSSRADLVAASTDSKLKSVRTFKGFLVNCYETLSTQLNGKAFILYPIEGTFRFIYDFESFIPDPSITIVGIENPENFRYIEKQKDLFQSIKPMFISRYPQNQNKDVIKWLLSIPNPYLHFGDFDFAGIGIFQNEFKTHLGDRANFYVPKNIESILKTFGNRSRYDVQQINFDLNSVDQDSILKLIDLIHHYKKGLDQEVLIKR